MPIPSFQDNNGFADPQVRRRPLSGMFGGGGGARGNGERWGGWKPGDGLMGISGLMRMLGRGQAQQTTQPPPAAGAQPWPQKVPPATGMPFAPPEGYNPGIQPASMTQPFMPQRRPWGRM